MMLSPSKRRKTSATTSVSVGARPSSPSQLVNKSPATPSRASYQAPTRASLARSHPNVLSKSPRRPVIEPRGRLLRKELLGARSSGFNAEPVSTGTTALGHDIVAAKPAESADATAAGHAAVPVQTNSMPSVRAASEPDPIPSETRSPLRPRQPPNATTPDITRPRFDAEEYISPVIEPKLVSRRERSPTRPGSKEPELPPTPVQLGLEPRPERPRGLFTSSSSPRGSKSGSGRRRRRLAGSTAMTSSPLKIKATPPQIQKSVQPAKQDHTPLATEAAESDAEPEMQSAAGVQAVTVGIARDETNTEQQGVQDNVAALPNDFDASDAYLAQGVSQRSNDQADEPVDVKERRALLLSLKNDLKRAHEQIQELEAAAKDASAAASDKGKLLKLLTADILEHKQAENGRKDLLDFGPHQEKYLSLFAPGNLQLRTTTNTVTTNNRQKIVHDIVLVPRAPWPPHTFRTYLQVTSDAENIEVENIKHVVRAMPSDGASRKELHSWIITRQESSLHQKDVAGLLWGVSRLFEECIRRAKVMAILDGRYNGSTTVLSDSDWKSAMVNAQDIECLLRHFNHSQMQFEGKEVDGSKAKIMLVWENALDWAGGVKSTKQIVLSGIPQKAQIAAKELFDQLIGSEGVIKAFAAVWDLVSSTAEET